MTSKDCGHDDDERKGGVRGIIGAILTLIVLVLLVVFIIWLVLRPTKPRFVLQDATIYGFNVTTPNLLTATFQVTVSSRNPNQRIGVYYERLDVFASYHNQQITLPTRLPYTYQGHKDITIWSPFLYGNSVPIAPYLGISLQQDQNAGLVLLNIKMNGKVKWKVGTWVSGKYHFNVNCPAYISFKELNLTLLGLDERRKALAPYTAVPDPITLEKYSRERYSGPPQKKSSKPSLQKKAKSTVPVTTQSKKSASKSTAPKVQASVLVDKKVFSEKVQKRKIPSSSSMPEGPSSKKAKTSQGSAGNPLLPHPVTEPETVITPAAESSEKPTSSAEVVVVDPSDMGKKSTARGTLKDKKAHPSAEAQPGSTAAHAAPSVKARETGSGNTSTVPVGYYRRGTTRRGGLTSSGPRTASSDKTVTDKVQSVDQPSGDGFNTTSPTVVNLTSSAAIPPSTSPVIQPVSATPTPPTPVPPTAQASTPTPTAFPMNVPPNVHVRAPPLFVEPSEYLLSDRFQYIGGVPNGNRFEPSFEVRADESLSYSIPERGGDLGYRLLRPMVLPFDRHESSVHNAGLTACHDMMRGASSVLALTHAYWSALDDVDRVRNENALLQAENTQVIADRCELKLKHEVEVQVLRDENAALQSSLKEHEEVLQSLQGVKEELSNQNLKVEDLQAELTAKEAEIARLQEVATSAATNAVAEYKVSDAFHRFLTCRFDGGWTAAMRCAKRRLPDMDWTKVEAGFEEGEWVGKLEEEGDYPSEFHVGNIHPNSAHEGENLSP